jgi:signal peptidase
LYHVIVTGYLLFIALVIIFSIDIFSPLHSFTNKSDSMNPVIDRGSITIVKEYPKYEIGDAISYYSKIDGEEEIITHRVVDIGGNVYTTKGDNNAVADRELVRPRLVIGKVIRVIPCVGHVITFAKSLAGTWLLIIFPAIIIISSELIRIKLEFKKEGEKL